MAKNPKILLGAIAGDIIGVPYERRPCEDFDFKLFTERSHFSDDTVLTLAVAEAILTDGDYGAALRRFGRRYPRAGYGGWFSGWLYSPDPQPYQSFGNGSAMRVSAVGWAFNALDDVMSEAEASASVTHDHEKGIKGARAVALSIYLARTGSSKNEIRDQVADHFDYDLDRTIDQIRPNYRWCVKCQCSVPESIIAFLDSNDYEDAVRLAITLGGDADTMAAIAGSIAEAYYGGVPVAIAAEVEARLPPDLWQVVEAFNQRYNQ